MSEWVSERDAEDVVDQCLRVREGESVCVRERERGCVCVGERER